MGSRVSWWVVVWLAAVQMADVMAADELGTSEARHQSLIEDEVNDIVVIPRTGSKHGAVRERSRRHMTKIEKKHWPKAIVPFEFHKRLDESARFEIKVAMYRIEKFSCIRFVSWVKNQTKHIYGLPDEAHIKFVSGSGCWASLGNRHDENGQECKCCKRWTCTHELGHNLGMFHEHSDPQRHGWISVNWQNIRKSNWFTYSPVHKDNSDSFRYDISSLMQYSEYGPDNENYPAMSVLFRDLADMLGNRGNVYYYWMDLAKAYSCTDKLCANFPMTCVNDGFVTYMDNKTCACMCPPGLDPDTGCATKRKVMSPSKWPSGNYGLLAASAGCPGNQEFQAGKVTQKSEGNSWTSQSLHLKGTFEKTSFTYNFCIKEGDVGTGPDYAEWDRGRYCIFKKGNTCPKDFTDGFIQFDNIVGTMTEVSGSIPEGVYGFDTLFRFCCRDDGYPEVPLRLPNDKPLILFTSRNSHECQQIDGMNGIMEYIVFDNDISCVKATYGGLGPYVYNKTNNFYLYFCYYVPLNTECGQLIELTRQQPTYEITSPGFPNPYNNSLDCFWIIKSPEDTNILLNFDKFDIAKSTKGDCEDKLFIRYGLLGQNAFEYCGSDMNRTIRSIYNTMSLNFKTDLTGNKTGFRARLSLVLPEVHCFNPEDRGLSYGGKVNFSRSFQPCLPWSEVTICPHHLFSGQSFDAHLEENYCRNPDNTFRPWCYTSVHDNQCERDYCDVCLLESKYDNFDDCEELTSYGFCEKDPHEVMAGCAETCNFPQRTATGVLETKSIVNTPLSVVVSTCPDPEPIADAIFKTTLKGVYCVGDNFVYQCKHGTEMLTRLCLSDGTWSPGGFVCGRCSKGWAPHKGSCYRYFDVISTYNEAEATCKQNSATVTSVKNEDEKDFILKIKQKATAIWIGATDRGKEGTFVWPDGSPVEWYNWNDDSPNNYMNQDCVVMDGEQFNNTWFDDFCDSDSPNDKFAFVCKTKHSERVLCVDHRPDCGNILQTNPRACKDFEDFSAYQCPYTCGLCQRNQTSNCSILDAGQNVTKVSPENGINRGEVAVYQCADRYTLVYGNLIRACTETGVLSGEPPVCVGVEDTVLPSNDVSMTSRVKIGSSKWSYLGKGKNFRIDHRGEIIQWQFYSEYSGLALLQVWRPRPEVGPLQYQFIGHNPIQSRNKRVETVDIHEYDRIQVRSGDIIGIHYAKPRAGIPYNKCNGTLYPEGTGVTWIDHKVFHPSLFATGELYAAADENECWVLSLKAIIGPIRAARLPVIRTSYVPLWPRGHVGSAKNVYSGNSTNFLIRHDGEIIQWQLFSNYIGEASLQVWRPRGFLEYSFVGQNVIQTADNKVQVIDIDEKQRIKVKTGDQIGVWYGLKRGGIPYTYCSDLQNPEAIRVSWAKGTASADDFKVGSIYMFSESLSCRIFSLDAIVLPYDRNSTHVV